MHISWAKSISLTSILLTAVALGACGNISHKVAADGSGAGQLVWPSPDSTTPMHKGGTFPNVSDLRRIKAGMNKPQIMQLIGAPHFSEGIWGVREWNYLFNFGKHGSDEAMQCQYKVLFDEHKQARSFYWQPESCASVLDEEKPVTVISKEQMFTLLSDALFVFDQSDVAHIRPGGMAQLELLAKKIEGRHDDVRHIEVVGYTDRLGSDAYNQTLSEKRAHTVLQILRDKGVSVESMNAEGRGKADPVKSCDERARIALIACLAPNRRVEVRVEGKSH